MGKKSGRKENSRHCGEKNVVLFRHRPYPKKTDIIAPVFTEQTAESAPAGINSSAVETHIPEAPARKKKKKRHRFPRPSHWTREYTHECVEKNKGPVSSSSC